MSFRVDRKGDQVLISVEGQLVASNRQHLKQQVADELERGARYFLIDFRETGYIDSAGLGVLVSLSKKIREEQGELRLANLNDDLKTLFELTRLDTLFELEDGDGSSGPTLRSRPSGPVNGGRRPQRDGEARP